ncbi:MAG TPA: RIP metalloprotease [Candidatus Saccharimonadales bacterium]|nr:RIP metalloprotease [Candidatus Saccharimonadales bacterium]
MQIALFVLAVILFIGLILGHEWGHFIVARRNGVDAEEFGLGFPPRAYGRRLKSGLLLSVNWLPLGGFVKLKGEHDNDTAKGSFGAAALGSKTKILLAGVAMNALIGLVLLTILGWVGMPVLISKDYNGQDQFTIKNDTHVIQQQVEAGLVIDGSPAQKIGLSSQDIITSVSYKNQHDNINTTSQLHDATTRFAGKKVTLTYKHSGKIETKDVQLLGAKEVEASNGQKGYLGVSPNQITIQRSTWSAPLTAIGFASQLVWLTVQGLGHAIGGLGSLIAGLVTGNHAARVNGQTAAESQVGGPVAIMDVLWNSGSLGFNFVIALIALISLTLALMNVLPIPALDGGRLFMMLVSRGIFKKPLAPETEEKIVGAGMVVLLALMVLITIVDVRRFF